MTALPQRSTLFPYTTLFRSDDVPWQVLDHAPVRRLRERRPDQRPLQVPEAGVGLGGAPEACELRSEEHTSELQSQSKLVCRLLLEKKNTALACQLCSASAL